MKQFRGHPTFDGNMDVRNFLDGLEAKFSTANITNSEDRNKAAFSGSAARWLLAKPELLHMPWDNVRTQIIKDRIYLIGQRRPIKTNES